MRYSFLDANFAFFGYIVLAFLSWFGAWLLKYQKKWLKKKFSLSMTGAWNAFPYLLPVLLTGFTPFMFYLIYFGEAKNVNLNAFMGIVYLVFLSFVGIKVSNYLVKKGF